MLSVFTKEFFQQTNKQQNKKDTAANGIRQKKIMSSERSSHGIKSVKFVTVRSTFDGWAASGRNNVLLVVRDSKARGFGTLFTLDTNAFSELDVLE